VVNPWLVPLFALQAALSWMQANSIRAETFAAGFLKAQV
jgi:hypothetical protein